MRRAKLQDLTLLMGGCMGRNAQRVLCGHMSHYFHCKNLSRCMRRLLSVVRVLMNVCLRMLYKAIGGYSTGLCCDLPRQIESRGSCSSVSMLRELF